MGLTQQFFAVRILEFEHVAAGFSGNQGYRGGFSFRTYSIFGDEYMLDKYYLRDSTLVRNAKQQQTKTTQRRKNTHQSPEDLITTQP